MRVYEHLLIINNQIDILLIYLLYIKLKKTYLKF